VQTGQPRLHIVIEHSGTGDRIRSSVRNHDFRRNSEFVIDYQRIWLGEPKLVDNSPPSPFGLRAFAASLASRAKAGGADRDRTDDLKLAKLALSQLSYGPKGCCQSDFRLSPRSRSMRWWARDELNVRPHAYQACALTT
jgi:hypothetical protein